jgi:hypothetical protein
MLQSTREETLLSITVGTMVKATLQGHHCRHGVIMAQI